jgi:hypothetical protein
MATVRRSKATRSDLALWDGINRTHSRVDATGGTTTGLTVGDAVDVLQSFGGGTDRTVATINATKSLTNTTLSFCTGTWVIDSNVTIASDLAVILPSGCVFAISIGVTLTINGVIYNESPTISSGAGTLVAPQITGPKRTTAEIAAAVTPTNYAIPTDQNISPKRQGAQQANSNAQNLTALNTEITVAQNSTGAASQGGVSMVIPADCHYGRKTADKTTHPQLSGTVPTIVFDYSMGDDYGTYPTTYAGTQLQIFMYTPQTTTLGTHDGNTIWLRAGWAPNWCVSNDMDLSGARLATDNRRASYTLFVNGVATYRMGQGTLASSTATEEELTNFVIEVYHKTGDTISAGYNAYLLERATGNAIFGGTTNSPAANYHFKAVSTGTYHHMIESLTTTAYSILRTSNGATDDAGLRNVSGDVSLFISTQGDAWTVTKATRRLTINQSIQLKRVAVTYSASMTIDTALGNYFTITANNGTAYTINAPTNAADGQRITIEISNTSGGALGTATWNGAFKMVAWTNPASANSRAIDFIYNGSNWRQVGTPVDVAN